MPNLGTFMVLVVLIGAGVGGGELLRKLDWQPESTRRFVHAWTGVWIAFSPHLLDDLSPLYLLGSAFVLINVWAIRRRAFPGMHDIERKSLGTAVFPLALLLALLTCWTPDRSRVFALQASFLVLALSDPLASLIGSQTRWNHRFRVAGDEKSMAGSGAFFASALALTFVAVKLWAPPPTLGSTLELLVLSAVVAAVATAAELIGRGGWDNLTIVVAVATPLVAVHTGRSTVLGLVIGLGFAVFFSVVSLKARFLTVSGTLAASLLAFSVVGLGGPPWAIPGLVFFFFGSVLSKLGRRRKKEAVQAEKGSQRDAGQAYANGGVAWALLLVDVFAPHPALFWGFIGAFAAAAADTWATEVGTYVRAPTRSLVTFRRVQPGMSGGVSLPGTIGALLGAGSVFLALPWVGAPSLETLGVVPAAGLTMLGGLLGSIVDSVLGATLQALYQTPDGQLTERRAGPKGPNQLVRGAAWMDNDVVNFACTAAGALFVALAVSAA